MTTTTSTQPLTVERDSQGVATLWLDAPHQPVVVFDRSLLARLDQAIDTLINDPPSMVIIRSSCSRVWVAGADLKEINSLDDEMLDLYLADGQRTFARLSNLPFPVIAAIDGAALGGGLELALHCHGIVVSRINDKDKPYPVGLPEAGLGLVPAWGGTQLLPARVMPSISVTAIATGTPFKSDELPEGLADAIVDRPDELDQAARMIADTIEIEDLPHSVSSCDNEESILAAVDHVRHTHHSNEASGVVAHCVSTGVKYGLAAGLDQEREGLVSLRNTEHTTAKLREFLGQNG
jgi:enoyl-CoA hydratase/carnithine racemase